MSESLSAVTAGEYPGFSPPGIVRSLGAIVGSPTVKNGGEKAVQPLRHDAPQSLAIAGQEACVIDNQPGHLSNGSSAGMHDE